MQVFIFESLTDRGTVCFTIDREGGNLPAEFGPWEPTGGVALHKGDGLAGVSLADPIISGLREDGFFIARTYGTRARHFSNLPRDQQ